MSGHWNSLPGGYDFSHWNGTLDWDRIAAQLPAFVIFKATEGMFADPEFERNRRGAADRGLLWLPYIFIRPDDGDAAMQLAISVIGNNRVPVALDWERAGVSSATVERWIDAVAADARGLPMMYYGLWPPDRVTPKIARCVRWYPQYPGNPDAPPRLPPWDGVSTDVDWSKVWLIWQWSDAGQVPGTAIGPDDLNRLACPVEVFRNWYETGVLLPPPSPPVPPLDVIEQILAASSFQIGVEIYQRQRGLEADGQIGPITLRTIGEDMRR
jgi:GH25 family lysozyme M1 (1,4-beta-N-acetylmuramidase)